MPGINKDQHPVILFDGVCNLCSNAVQFVIKRDKNALFKFASLQSSFGQNLLNQYHLPSTGFDSFILLENEIIYTKSTAALKVVRQLSGAWPLLYIFSIIPAFIRNTIYNFIARNRYKWFGKKEACWIASPELKNRFLD
jgi:predicted DCC family thiol-disulfide oxidoreductase YuxK